VVDDDQFTVNATVDPSITFTLNDITVTLGTLTVSQVYTDTTSFTINTNATGGYSVTATEDGNLRTATADINDVSDGTVNLGNEEYGMSTNKATQDFAQTGANAATAIDGTAKHCASAGGPVSSDTTTLTLLAAVSGTTPAGSYSHIVTLIATGNF
jgi:paraquat-inducible protein B